MPFTPHTLFEFGGKLHEGSSHTDEIWTCGVRCRSFNTKGPLAAADLASVLANMVNGGSGDGSQAGLKAWFGGAAAHMGSNATLEWAKLNNIGADGKYSEPTTTELDFAPVSGAGSPQGPSFCTVAYTWETGLQRGRAHRGRIYPPNYCYAPVGATISAADRDQAAQEGVYLLEIINDAHNTAADDRAEAIVASRIDGATHVITGVSCDDVYDVQRRRKNRVRGLRSAVLPIPYP